MIEKLRAYWASRDPREQLWLAVGAALLLLAIIYLAWSPLAKERDRLQRRLPQLQADVARMQSLVGKWQAAGGAARQDWRNATQARLSAHGIVGPQARMISSTSDSQQWQFDKVPFNSFLDWLSGLYNEYGVRVKSAVITPEGAGVVSVKLELTHL